MTMEKIHTDKAPAAIGPYSQADFGAFNGVYGEYFTSKPARSCVAVKALPKGVLAEVEVIAKV